MAHSYAHLYGLPTTGLRFFTVYGPWGRPDMAPMLFADAITSGRPIKVFNQGDMSRDFTFIDDIVEGIIRVADKVPKAQSDWTVEQGTPATSSAPYRVYNIGNGSPVRLLDFISELEAALGQKAEKKLCCLCKMVMSRPLGQIQKIYLKLWLTNHKLGSVKG